MPTKPYKLTRHMRGILNILQQGPANPVHLQAKALLRLAREGYAIVGIDAVITGKAFCRGCDDVGCKDCN
jgi:hypothetical protein